MERRRVENSPDALLELGESLVSTDADGSTP
eukprot:COSAG06_NODE_38830_length_419_cov_0.975000_2_plen_30_part_01